MQEFGVFCYCNSFVTREEIKKLVFESVTGLKYGRTAPDFDFHVIGNTKSPCSSLTNAQILAQDRYLKCKSKLTTVYAVPFYAATSIPGVDLGNQKLDEFLTAILKGIPYDTKEAAKLRSSRSGRDNVYYIIIGKITF